jgi:hypothetical protein
MTALGGRAATAGGGRVEAAPAVEQRAPVEALRALLAAAWLAVGRPPLLVPAGAALALLLGTIPWQDVYGVRVLHGVAVLLACALTAATDDPAGEVVAAAPVPRHVRTLSRVTAAALVVVPVAVLAVVVVRLRSPFVPLGVTVLELVGFAVLGVALGSALRAWAGLLRPSYAAVVGVVLLALGVYALPRGWVLLEPQPWGRPYDAALLRWAGLIVLALGVVGLALRDPAARHGVRANRP